MNQQAVLKKIFESLLLVAVGLGVIADQGIDRQQDTGDGLQNEKEVEGTPLEFIAPGISNGPPGKIGSPIHGHPKKSDSKKRKEDFSRAGRKPLRMDKVKDKI